MVARLRLTLPAGWFEDSPPVMGGLLAGLAEAWAGLYSLLALVRVQSRLATVTGVFLDLACTDFFGSGLVRRGGESDAALRPRFMRAMRRERGTRAGLIAAAADAGFAAVVFEPARLADTGGYSIGTNLAWGVAGGWGSFAMPLECLVTVTPMTPVANVGSAIAVAVPSGGAAWVRMAG